MAMGLAPKSYLGRLIGRTLGLRDASLPLPARLTADTSGWGADGGDQRREPAAAHPAASASINPPAAPAPSARRSEPPATLPRIAAREPQLLAASVPPPAALKAEVAGSMVTAGPTARPAISPSRSAVPSASAERSASPRSARLVHRPAPARLPAREPAGSFPAGHDRPFVRQPAPAQQREPVPPVPVLSPAPNRRAAAPLTEEPKSAEEGVPRISPAPPPLLEPRRALVSLPAPDLQDERPRPAPSAFAVPSRGPSVETRLIIGSIRVEVLPPPAAPSPPPPAPAVQRPAPAAAGPGDSFLGRPFGLGQV